jgi:hypothetical protein
VALLGGVTLKKVLFHMTEKLWKKTFVDVGFLENAKYPDGTSVAMIAAIQEFGAPRRGIPPRPFMRPTFKAKADEWVKQIAIELKDTKYNGPVAFGRVGAMAAGDFQQAIADLHTPALSPVTLMVRMIVGPGNKGTFKDVLEARARVAKGEVASGVSEKPLIWSGVLIGSVNFRVRKN